MTIAGKILRFIDRVANFLTGGDISNTISARVGYHAFTEESNPYWRLMEGIISFSFWPIDGPNHCLDAYIDELERDPNCDFNKGSKILMILLAVIVVISCYPISIVLWAIKLFKNLFNVKLKLK